MSVKLELIEGYFVEADEMNYTLKKRYIGTDKNGDNKDAEKVIGYYKSVQDCLERIIRLIPLDKNEGTVISLREYAEAAEKAFKKCEEWRMNKNDD